MTTPFRAAFLMAGQFWCYCHVLCKPARGLFVLSNFQIFRVILSLLLFYYVVLDGIRLFDALISYQSDTKHAVTASPAQVLFILPLSISMFHRFCWCISLYWHKYSHNCTACEDPRAGGWCSSMTIMLIVVSAVTQVQRTESSLLVEVMLIPICL